MLLDLPYLYEDIDRHGNVRLFARRYGRKIRLREPPGTPAFTEEYNNALAALARYAHSLSPALERKPQSSKTVE